MKIGDAIRASDRAQQTRLIAHYVAALEKIASGRRDGREPVSAETARRIARRALAGAAEVVNLDLRRRA